MKKLRTFVDSGVLIFAARGTGDLSNRAFQILDDPQRQFISSDFVRLEVLPKALFNRSDSEAAFYEAFFAAALRTVKSSARLVAEAVTEAIQFGLSAVDSLHVAAARHAKCDEFVTAEKATKPLFRVRGLTLVTIVGE